ncbi:conserved protein of unknown function [Rhodovastum atsumiense]|uniref:Uncharacterized protein n=1 Tax=Rhodovastum atsumiense TaxID=504468 RepID=A0A5M6IYD3_9PROT|nr:hypothetical protein [Rhodovastum atsumiense]KAA5612375.1 hypothetical protein F1189_09360 [Rhodovastum atsumiense]CAH2600275.1 conserved protein of unknown function [Rhodovastum atsumiense]
MQTHDMTTTGPDGTPAGFLQQMQRHKAELEAALLADPQNTTLRGAYFDHLGQMAAQFTGLSHALLPELGQPLHFRGASADIGSLTRVFRDGCLDVEMRATPRRILVLGGYVGYAAVWLAWRHPRAMIACVEPLATNARLLALNAGPWPRIRMIQAAAWHSPTRLGVGARVIGDWLVQLHDQMNEAERTIPALTVTDLLRHLGWPQLDLLVCDTGGAAETAVFADPTARWLDQLDAAMLPGKLPAGLEPALAGCFDANQFERRSQDEITTFLRRVPLRAYPPAPPPLPLISPEPQPAAVATRNLEAVPWAFFTFDGRSMQLHPNMPGQPSACAVFARDLAGQTRFTTTLHHAGGPAAAVVFSLAIEDAAGAELLRAEQVVASRERMPWSVRLPALSGPHRVVLRTDMAPGAANNYNAWARWLEPELS